MNSVSALIIALLAGVGIGGFAGWFWAIKTRNDNKRKLILELENQLEEAQRSRRDYESEVTAHFNTTANLFNKLSKDYRAVYAHLARGADQLCDDNVSMSDSPLPLSENESEIHPQFLDLDQPLDYAPKKPDEQGQLSETFGLEKSNQTVN